MSNRTARNIKSSGQAVFRRQAEEVRKFIQHCHQQVLHINTCPATPAKMEAKREEVVKGFAYASIDVSGHVPVYHRKHRHV